MKFKCEQRISRMRRSAWALATALAAALAGCGGEGIPKVGTLYPVKGKVTLPDGKPLPEVKVIFSGPVTNNAVTGSDGTFAFAGDSAGLPAGDYKVYLEVVKPKGSLKRPVDTFPQKYADEDTSDLKATVKAEGPNDFDFKLTKGEAAVQEGPRSGGAPARVKD